MQYRFSEKDALSYAKYESKWVSWRCGPNGPIIARRATPKEAKAVEAALGSALAAIRSGYDRETALEVAASILEYGQKPEEPGISARSTIWLAAMDFLEYNKVLEDEGYPAEEELAMRAAAF